MVPQPSTSKDKSSPEVNVDRLTPCITVGHNITHKYSEPHSDHCIPHLLLVSLKEEDKLLHDVKGKDHHTLGLCASQQGSFEQQSLQEACP